MEELKEEISFTRNLFYIGRATFKYRGDYDTYRSEKEGIDHFRHARYYDITIKDIRQLPDHEYLLLPRVLEIHDYDEKITGFYKEKSYTLNLDKLEIVEPIVLSHSQKEGDELHAYVENVAVVFQMHRAEKGVVCKADFATGQYEERADGLYREFTTGVQNEDGSCETEWRREGGPPPPPEKECPRHEPTGNRQERDLCFRIEYYSGERNADGTCETYWGKWICECEQDKPTGRERQIGEWIQTEHYNQDCSTYWKNDRKAPKGCLESMGGCSDGCSGIFTWLPVLLIAVLSIWLAVKYGSFMPILFGIGVPLILASLGWIQNFLGRFPNSVSRFLRWMMNLFIVIIIASLLNGMGSLFDSSNWQFNPEPVKHESSYEIEEVEEDEMTGETAEANIDLLRVKIKWHDLHGNKYNGTYYLNKEKISASTTTLSAVESMHYRSYQPVYQAIYNQDKEALTGVYHMLDSIKLVNTLSEYQFAEVVTTMVQSIEYVMILDRGCNDPMVLQQEEIREMIRAGVPCEGNAPYGLKTPLEFLSTMKGDCDTRTLLLYTIFKHYNYDVAIINSEYYGHSMLGLSLRDARGIYKLYNGKKYYFWETTATGFSLGTLPPENGNLKFWYVELN